MVTRESFHIVLKASNKKVFPAWRNRRQLNKFMRLYCSIVLLTLALTVACC